MNSILGKIVARLISASSSMPTRWDARDAILAMKDAAYPHWRQMEWIGFYFQFLCERAYKGVLEMPGRKYGRVEFDAFAEICWDFKAHAANTMRHDLITNDSEAIENAIHEYGYYGLILAIGEVEYNDEERTFKKWHDALKGGQSSYEIARIERGAMSRRRKTEFLLREIHIICLDSSSLNACSGSFQEGFRNADGSPRRKKVLVSIPNIPDSAIAETVRFKST